MSIHIREAVRSDLSRIQEIAVLAGMFTADEAGFLAEHFPDEPAVPGPMWWVAMEGDRVVGATYCAPEPFADRMWNLYFIAVDPETQGSGVGRALMGEVEARLVGLGGSVARTLVVETSSTPAYEGARGLYSRLGYDREAVIRDFYGPGDNKVVFWKALDR